MSKPGKTSPSAPTADTYTALQSAYDHFNRDLFAGELPACLITLQRQSGAYGYFSRQRFHARRGKGKADEIAMNPSHIGKRSLEATLSTLAHEMVHLWQHHFGKPGRRGYHNTEWATKMNAIGLTPTTTGEPGGKQTGERVTHMIAKGGPFAQSCAALLKTGLTLTWHDPHGKALSARSSTRTKYTCAKCGLNAWAKPAAHLVCGDCEAPMQDGLPQVAQARTA